jgi:hypothetical protein
MKTYASVAASVRTEKQNHPERFCANPTCLWRIVTRQGASPCQKHPVVATTPKEAHPETSTAACNACQRDVRVRVAVRCDRQRCMAFVCGGCALALAERFHALHEKVTIEALVPASLNPWLTSDGRFFAADVDGKAHQATLDQLARRYADRVRRVVAQRLAERTKNEAA